jgi:hypothetical protein
VSQQMGTPWLPCPFRTAKQPPLPSLRPVLPPAAK